MTEHQWWNPPLIPAVQELLKQAFEAGKRGQSLEDLWAYSNTQEALERAYTNARAEDAARE